MVTYPKIPEARVKELKHREDLVLKAVKNKPDISFPELEQITKLEPVQVGGAIRSLGESIIKTEAKMTPGGVIPSTYRLAIPATKEKEPWQMTKEEYFTFATQNPEKVPTGLRSTFSSDIWVETGRTGEYRGEKSFYLKNTDTGEVREWPASEMYKMRSAALSYDEVVGNIKPKQRTDVILKETIFGKPVPPEVLKDYPELRPVTSVKLGESSEDKDFTKKVMEQAEEGRLSPYSTIHFTEREKKLFAKLVRSGELEKKQQAMWSGPGNRYIYLPKGHFERQVAAYKTSHPKPSGDSTDPRSPHAIVIDNAILAKKVTTNRAEWEKYRSNIDLRGIDTPRRKVASHNTGLHGKRVGKLYHTKIGKGTVLSRRPLGRKRR